MSVDRSTAIQRADIAPPQIFISSTFENLVEELRDALRRELEDYNYYPVMSELGTFAYTHGKFPIAADTIAVVPTCQLYVLVIGRRYGSRDSSGYSITEREYQQAFSSNLPILVYVHRHVWEGFEAFKRGAVGDPTYWVDETDVFDFIERVAVRDGLRCVPFSRGSEIIDDFRKQCANLFGAYLRFDLKAARWLWNEWRTRDIERTTSSVWIITPNFYWDYQDPEFRQIVFNNVVGRSVRYFYIYRETDENNRRIAEMVSDYEREIGDRWKEQVHFIGLPDQVFVWL